MSIDQEYFTPSKPHLWDILNAGHIGFPKILEEFLDNALSAGAERVHIQLQQQPSGNFLMTVYDDGCGITEDDLSRVFGVGHAPDAKQAGPHNQFGIGLKSALASCDPDNRFWSLYTCQQDACILVRAPYSPASMAFQTLPSSSMPRPDGWSTGAGTCFTTPVSQSLFHTCMARAVNDEEHLAALLEELRVTYAPLLAKRIMTLEWIPLVGKPQFHSLLPLLPQWESGGFTKTERIDFGAGPLEVRYAFGKIQPNPDAYHYFKGNITSSGLMVYLNGRLIQYNLFSLVWNQPHPQFNKFLFQVDLRMVDGNRDALPIPRPDKDQMITGDPRFANFVKWIRKLCPDPRAIVSTPHEKEELTLCRKLADRLEKSGTTNCVKLELPIEVKDGGTATRADVYAQMKDGRAVLYEGKAKLSRVQDVSQLAAYYLLSADNGLQLDELVLVAKRHTPEVHAFITQLTRRWYRDLPVPMFRCLTWADVESGNF